MTNRKEKNQERDRNDLQDLMSRLVTINSVFPKEQTLSRFIERYLTDMQFSVIRVPSGPGRDNLFATTGRGATLCFYGHMDTVPPDPKWKQNPFSVQIHRDIARGLGVADMKGGVAVILLAARYASRNRKPLALAFGVDEENISLGSHTLAETDLMKGITMLISAESGQITNTRQDFSVTYGRNGRFVIEATVFGVTAHAARSDLAINAIDQASILITSLNQLTLPAHARLGKTQIIPFFTESHTNSFSIPSRSTIRLNVLTVPGVTSAMVILQLEKLSRRLSIQSHFIMVQRSTPYMEAYEIHRTNRRIRQLEQSVFSHFTVSPEYATSVADENRFAHCLRIPVISIGPIGGNDHTANEWVSINSMQKTLTAYKTIIDLT